MILSENTNIIPRMYIILFPKEFYLDNIYFYINSLNYVYDYLVFKIKNPRDEVSKIKTNHFSKFLLCKLLIFSLRLLFYYYIIYYNLVLLS